MNFYRNSERYFDPTAGAALSKIYREERSKHRKAIRKKNKQNRCREVSKNVETNRSLERNGNVPVAEPRKRDCNLRGEGLPESTPQNTQKADQQGSTGGDFGH